MSEIMHGCIMRGWEEFGRRVKLPRLGVSYLLDLVHFVIEKGVKEIICIGEQKG